MVSELARQVLERERRVRQQRVSEMFRELEERDAKLKAELVAPDGVENMVAKGRKPFFQQAFVGWEQTEVAFCYVPPIGTKHGDKMARIHGWAYNFTSPKGVVRGFADRLTFTPQEAALLQARIQAVSPVS